MIIPVDNELKLRQVQTSSWNYNLIDFSSYSVANESDLYGVFSFQVKNKLDIMKEIINERWYEGVLCSVDTEDEFNELYKFVQNLEFTDGSDLMSVINRVGIVDEEDYNIEDGYNVHKDRKVLLGVNIQLHIGELGDNLTKVNFYPCSHKFNALPKMYRGLELDNPLPRQWMLFNNIDRLPKVTIDTLNKISENNNILSHIFILND